MWAHRLTHADEWPLHREHLLQLLVACFAEDLILELVDPVVEGGQDREEAIDEPVDDPVEQQRGTVDRLVALLVAPPDLGERRAFVPVNGDEEAVGVEAVHLDEAVLVRRGAVEHEEDEVVVILDFRPLVEVLRVLDGERVEPKTSRRMFPLALLFLCGGAATQVGVGGAALVASGVEASKALAVAVSVGALGVFSGAAILLSAIAWPTARSLMRRSPHLR
jgi:hypothetical protein